MSKPAKSGLPRVDLDTFADIVEGRYSCPTLKELVRLAESDVRGDDSAPDGAEDVRIHLQKCADCGEDFQMLQMIARTARDATDRAVEMERAGA